jgi:hypothetical protein
MIPRTLAFVLSIALLTGSFPAPAFSASGGDSARPAEGAKAPSPKKKRSRRKSRRKTRSKKSAAPAKPAKRAPRVKSGLSGAAANDLLLAFGASVGEEDGGLRLLHVRRGSAADDLGLRDRDTLLTLNGRRVRTPAAAAKALRSWKAETRLSAVVSRLDSRLDDGSGRADLRGELTLIEGKTRYWPRSQKRDAEVLSAEEANRKKRHIAAASEASKRPLKTLKAPGFRVAAGEKVWVRFPNGIPQTVQTGDVVEGQTSAPMASDKTLDFIVVPEGSRVWAQVVSNQFKNGGRVVRLVVFKITLDGGRTYPASGMVRAVSGGGPDIRITPGGSLVAAPDDEDPHLLPPERNLQIEFRRDLIVLEREDFYKAGPGLWLRTVAGSDGRSFEVSHVIRGRSAHAKGVKKGDRVSHIDGRPVHRLGFSGAIRRLYGSAGTNVELKMLGANDRKPRRVKLRRGAGYRRGYGLNLSAGKEGAYVLDVEEESPAYEAGIRRGHRIDSIGGTETAGLGAKKLKALLKISGKKSVRFKPRDRKARTEELTPSVYPYARSIRSRLIDVR